MQRKYRRITQNERDEISVGLSAGRSQADIARQLDHPTSAVSREVKRNGGRKTYRSSSAGLRTTRTTTSRRRGRTKLSANPCLRRKVEHMLRAKLSPDRISAKLQDGVP